MTTPLIGITTTRGKHAEGFPTNFIVEAYVNAVAQAGGAPVLIPLGLPEATLQDLLARLDGILFSGGGDIQPEVFKGAPHAKVDLIDVDRDRVELYLFQESYERRKPFLGICRGFQVINVGMGGTLYTHILDQHPGALQHSYHPGWPRNHLAHGVQVEKTSRLAQVLGGVEAQVNSLHHQGAEKLAAGLIPTAYAPDGLIEALEVPDYPFGLAVQWHPEWLQDQQPMRNLFRALVEAARLDR